MAKVKKRAVKKAAKKSSRSVKKAAKKHKWKLQIVYEPIDKLTEWEKNPRHNDEAAEKLCKLLDKNGFINPVVATPDGVIRAGHTRIKAAQMEGYADVPVIYVPFASEQEAEMYSISDNKASEWAQWNRERLSEIFKNTGKVGVSTVERMSGFSQVEIEGLRKRHANLASQTFADAVETFNRDNPDKVKQEAWAWMMLPDDVTLREVMQKFSRKYNGKGEPTGRELETAKFLDALDVKHGPTCPDCGGNGHRRETGLKGRLRCDRCTGSGILPLPSSPAGKKVKRKVKKVRK